MEQVSFFFRLHISSTSARGIQLLYNPLPMLPLIPNPDKRTPGLVLPVVDMATKVAESVAVSDVVEVEVVTEAMEAVVAAHKFEMGMIPLLVYFSIEQLQLDQQPLC